MVAFLVRNFFELLFSENMKNNMDNKRASPEGKALFVKMYRMHDCPEHRIHANRSSHYHRHLL